MEKFLENVLTYGLNLAVDNVHNSIQSALAKEESVVSVVLSAVFSKVYYAIIIEINQS